MVESVRSLSLFGYKSVLTLYSDDTRAAHLDRSKTKGQLKLTALRIDYQRQRAKDKMGNGQIRPVTVDGYFGKSGGPRPKAKTLKA